MTRPTNITLRKALGDPFPAITSLDAPVEMLLKVDDQTAARIEVVRVLARSLVKGLPGLSWVREFADSMATIEGSLVSRTSLIASFLAPIVEELVKSFEGHDLPFLPALRNANTLLKTLIKVSGEPAPQVPQSNPATDLLDLISKRQPEPQGPTFLEHATAWVNSRGLLDSDSDYEGALGKAVIRMAEVFNAEGHSGTSALLARAYFNFLCDAWDGKETFILNDADAAKAKEALSKALIGLCEAPDRIVKGQKLASFERMISRIERAGQQLVGGIRESYKTEKILKLDDTHERVLHIVQKDESPAGLIERYVFGIVLVPEEVDKQNDIYSEEEVRNAAFTFMKSHRNVGDTHKKIIAPGFALDGRVSIVENYIAKADMEINGHKIKKGTWLMGVFVQDDQLWEAIKSGDYTGFSIGGEALRVPADTVPQAA